ncbi:Noc2p family-domain-containing protein [Pholiota molesta]|nr:Noc2p family-domain-containing protein [Pholiota molesta]
MGKATKATKKYVASGQLKKAIQARHKRQEVTKKIQKRRGNKDSKGKGRAFPSASHEDDDGDDDEEAQKPGKSFLNGDFMDGSDDDEGSGGDMGGDDFDEDNDDDEEMSDDDGSFASVDDLDAYHGTRETRRERPRILQYLQENDKELLDFNADELAEADLSDEQDEDGDVSMEEEEQVPILTKDHLRQWSKSLLQQRSLRSLRKLLIAFRSAAHMNEDGQVLAWSIDSSSVYNKVVTTALRYTPMVLEHHVPYKTLPSGKIKAPAQTPKFKTLQKLILSHFHNIIHILSQLTDEDTLRLALTESAKLIPYITSSRKSVKAYLKKCLDLWSSGSDSIRIAAFLSIRRLAASADESVMDSILKSTYLALIRSSKSTSAHTLPAINLMKNSASEVFCLDHATAYQHAFGYIRQLAIHLRNSMKVKSKEAYKNVYNWQFVHCIDFWCIVLARACLHWSIKLVPNSRSHPFHLQIIRSLLNLTKHTQTYIPLSTHLVPIIVSCLVPSSRPKSSTLRPLDLDVQIRVPQQYLKTRVLSEGLTEETVYLLAEWLSSAPVHGSIAFPEIVTGSSKESGLVKVFLERVEESAKWMEQRRKAVQFAPSKIQSVQDWEGDLKAHLPESPLGKYMKVQRKTREKRRKLVEKAREGEDEILEED